MTNPEKQHQKPTGGEILKIVKPKIKTIRAEKYDEHPIKYI